MENKNLVELVREAKSFFNKNGVDITIKFDCIKKYKDGDKVFPLYKITLNNDRHSFTYDMFGSEEDARLREMTYSEYCWNVCPYRYSTKNITEYDFMYAKNRYALCEYDVLISLPTKDLGDFIDFCYRFGYDENSIIAKVEYNKALFVYNNLKKLLPDKALKEIEEIKKRCYKKNKNNR